MTKTVGIVAGILVIAVSVFVFIKGGQNKEQIQNDQASNIPVESVIEPTGKNEDSQVPLPSPESLIRTFFELINEKRIPAAIDMMDIRTIGDESSRQEWGVQLNSLSNIQVKNIEPAMQEDWNQREQIYKVTLDLKVSESGANAPIPYYGWENGTNIRFVSMEKNDRNIWKIMAVATGL